MILQIAFALLRRKESAFIRPIRVIRVPFESMATQ